MQITTPNPSRQYAQYANHLSLRLQLLLDLAAGLDALQYALAVLVELQLGDDNFRWVDADGN